MSETPDVTGKELPSSIPSALDGIHQRISALVAELSSTDKVAVELAATASGASKDSIKRWRTGPTMPPFDNVVALCLNTGFRVEWIATGEGPRRLQSEIALLPDGTKEEHGGGSLMQISGAQASDQKMVLLPRLSVEASAGQGLVPTEDEIEGFVAFKAQFLRDLGINPANAHILIIKGNSMYPTLRHGELVVIDASLIEVLKEGLYTLVYDGAIFAKRLQPLLDGSVVISSDNKEEGYRSETVPASMRHTLKIVGRIRGVYRNL